MVSTLYFSLYRMRRLQYSQEQSFVRENNIAPVFISKESSLIGIHTSKHLHPEPPSTHTLSMRTGMICHFSPLSRHVDFLLTAADLVVLTKVAKASARTSKSDWSAISTASSASTNFCFYFWVSSISKNLRLPCAFPGCDRTFSDPSSLTKHRRIFHGVRVRLTPGPTSGREMRFAPYSVLKIEEHSGQGMTSFRITTPSLYDPAADDTRPTLGASSSSTNEPSCMPPCELPGVFRRAKDVRIDCMSVDIRST